MELKALPHPQKQPIVLPKTTYRFTENDVSFCWKQRVTLQKTTYHFVLDKDWLFLTAVTLVTAKRWKLLYCACALRACARESLPEKWRWNAKQCCTKVSKLFWGELYQKKVTLIGLDKHYAFYCCSQTYLIAKISIY